MEYDIEEIEEECPECGSETEDMIGEGYTGQTFVGMKCKECEWEVNC